MALDPGIRAGTTAASARPAARKGLSSSLPTTGKGTQSKNEVRRVCGLMEGPLRVLPPGLPGDRLSLIRYLLRKILRFLKSCTWHRYGGVRSNGKRSRRQATPSLLAAAELVHVDDELLDLLVAELARLTERRHHGVTRTLDSGLIYTV
jgi:hypothetical protein